MPVLLAFAVETVVAEAQGDAGHDAVAGLEGCDGRADADDYAGAFVGGGAGEGSGKFAGCDHGVGVAEGGYCRFEEELGWVQGVGGGHFVGFVGFVELNELD